MADYPFQILSPDGFSINLEGGFNTWQEAFKYYNEWKLPYDKQGHYSSPTYGKINPLDLADFCQWIGFDNVPTVDYLTDEEKHLIDSVSTQ